MPEKIEEKQPTIIKSHRQELHLKSRHVPIVSNLTDGSVEEVKEKFPQRRDSHKMIRSKETTILPTQRYGHSTIGETDLRVSLERDPMASAFDSEHAGTTLGPRDDTSLSRRFTTLESSRNHLYIQTRNVNTPNPINGVVTNPKIVSLRRAWDEKPLSGTRYDKAKLKKAQDHSVKYYFDSKAVISRNYIRNIKLPKITSPDKTNFIVERDEEEEEAKFGSQLPPIEQEESKEIEFDDHVLQLMPLNSNQDRSLFRKSDNSPPNSADKLNLQLSSRSLKQGAGENNQESPSNFRLNSEAGLVSRIAPARAFEEQKEELEAEGDGLHYEEIEKLI